FPNASEYPAATPHCVARSEMSFIVQELLAVTIPTGLGITAGGAYWDKIFFNGIRAGRGDLGVNAARKPSNQAATSLWRKTAIMASQRSRRSSAGMRSA